MAVNTGVAAAISAEGDAEGLRTRPWRGLRQLLSNGVSRDEELELAHGSQRKEETILKTKALLGALVVAVLAVFGVIGLRNAPDARAGDFAGATGFSPSTVLVGGTATSTITFYDDRPGTSSMIASAPGLTFTASSAVLASEHAPCHVQYPRLVLVPRR